MLVRNCFRRIGELVVASLALALVAAPCAGAALPGGYTSRFTDNPPPASGPATAGERFGEHIVNAGDFTGDGRDDLMVGVPRAPGGGQGVTGKVVFINGVTGETRSVPAPFPQVSHAGADTDFGAQVATLGDLDGDNVPEYLVSAPGTDISSSNVDMGVVYVIRGASLKGPTVEIMKQIQLAADDRPSSSPGFGKALAAAGGEPACGPGFAGTAACPDAPRSSVAIGDLDGGGKPDIVIGAPDYGEDAAADTNPYACPLGGPATCPGLGRVYVYSGEDVTAGSKTTPLETPTFPPIKYFDAASADQQPRLGAVVSPIGDVGSCVISQDPGPSNANCLTAGTGYAPTNVPDGYPDFLVSAPGLTVGGVAKSGEAFVVDGQHGLLIGAVGSPDPQPGSGFGSAVYPQAPGNLGGSALPDLYLSATGLDHGRGYALSGDPTAPGLLYRLDDPSAPASSGFGVFAGLGDVAGNDLLSEFALGRLAGGPVKIVSACGPTLALEIADQDPGSGFGAGIAPMGDLNGDGYIDLAVGAPGHGGGVGRVYFMESNATAGPNPSCAPPTGGGGGGGGGGSGGGGGGSTGGGSSGGGNPSGGGTVSSLTKRRLTLKPAKSKVKISSAFSLHGNLRASKKKRSCQVKQKVAILRFDPNSGGWPTIDVAVTNKKGNFATKLRPPALAQTFLYRARVKQTKRCGGAFSKKIKVKVTA